MLVELLGFGAASCTVLTPNLADLSREAALQERLG